MGEIGGPEGERGNKEVFANFLRIILQEKDVEATCTGKELGTWAAGRVCNRPSFSLPATSSTYIYIWRSPGSSNAILSVELHLVKP